MKIGKKGKLPEAWKEYKKSKQNAKRMCKQLNDPYHKNELFCIAKQMVKERQDIMESNCLKRVSGKVVVDEKVIRFVEGVHGKADE